MKQLVGVQEERILFFRNLHIRKYWELELQNVFSKLESLSSSGEEIDALWRLLVLEWNSFTRDNLKYFLNALNNCKNTRQRVQWYNLMVNSEYAGDILFLNQVKKDLLGTELKIRNSALQMACFGEDEVWLDLKEIIEQELESKDEQVRKNASRAYLEILRKGRGDFKKLLKTLVDSSPRVMKIGLLGIKEFSLYKQVDIRQGLLHILKQIQEPLVKIRILQILENFQIKEDDLAYLTSLLHDQKIGLHVKRLLLMQGIFNLEEIKRDLESLQPGKVKMSLLLVMMLPWKEKMQLLEQVKQLKESNGSLIKKFCFKILSEIGDFQDLMDFLGFWQEFANFLDENECMKNVNNWLSRDYNDIKDLEKIKGLMISIRLLRDESRLEIFDQVLAICDRALRDDENLECLNIFDEEIQNTDVLETNISRLYLILLEKFRDTGLLIKIMVDCVYKCSDVVLQERFVSLIKKKTQGSTMYETQIIRLFKLETKDDLILKVYFLIKTLEYTKL